MSLTNKIISDENRIDLLSIKQSFNGAVVTSIDAAFSMGYAQALREFKDRTYTPKQYKITYSDFGTGQQPIYNADFKEAMALVKDLEKRKMQEVEIEMVDIREE